MEKLLELTHWDREGRSSNIWEIRSTRRQVERTVMWGCHVFFSFLKLLSKLACTHHGVVCAFLRKLYLFWLRRREEGTKRRQVRTSETEMELFVVKYVYIQASVRERTLKPR